MYHVPVDPLAPVLPWFPLDPFLPLLPGGPSGPGGQLQVCSVCLFIIPLVLSWFVIVWNYILIKYSHINLVLHL